MTEAKPSIARRVGAVVAALVAGGVVMFAVQALNFALYPPPAGLSYEDPAQLEQIMAAMPLGAWLVLELSYALGCLAAGALAARIARGAELGTAAVVGVAFTLLGFVNLAQVPTPLWVAVLTTLTYLPTALAGALLLARRPSGERASTSAPG